MDLRDLTAENTQPLVGTTFRIEFNDGKTADLLLERVDVLLEKHVSKKMRRDSFGMYFVGPPNLYIAQGMYPTHHETLGGPMNIFFVPISRRDDGAFLFEAVFT